MGRFLLRVLLVEKGSVQPDETDLVGKLIASSNSLLVSSGACPPFSPTSVTVGLLSASLGWLELLLVFVLPRASVKGSIPSQLWVYFSIHHEDQHLFSYVAGALEERSDEMKEHLPFFGDHGSHHPD